MEGTWKELRCFREHNKTRYREQNNRTIGIGKYLRWDLTTLGNRVRSGHPCTGLRSGHFGFSGSWVLGFLGFSGVARKGKGLSRKLQGCCSKPWKNAGKSCELQGSLGLGTEHSQD